MQFVRPIIQYTSVVYGPLCNERESMRLERLQVMALKIIYGHSHSYASLLKKSDLKTLKERRNDALERFAVKIEKNERFAVVERNMRRTDKYKTVRPNCERLKNGHLNLIRAILNSKY